MGSGRREGSWWSAKTTVLAVLQPQVWGKEERRKAAQEDGLKENEANGIHRIQSGKKQPNALEDKRAAFQKFVWNTAAKRELQKCCREKKSMVCRKISHWNKG